MPGCLPLFFLLAMIVVGTGLWLAPVEMPARVRPKGVGKVYVKNDRLTDFVLRRKSPLPLHLPLHADPEYQEDLAAASMPLIRRAQIVPPPPQELFEPAADSAVLDATALLELPPVTAAAAEAPVPESPVEAPTVSQSATGAPAFPPAAGGEEVQP